MDAHCFMLAFSPKIDARKRKGLPMEICRDFRSAFTAIAAVLVLAVPARLAWTQPPNLLPNGDVENVFVNHIKLGEGRSTTIEAWDSGVPTFWRLEEGAALSEEESQSGERSVVLRSGAAATVFTDYWRVKDPAMPFGLPLPADLPVEVQFFYKTSGFTGDALTAEVTLGTVDGLGSDTKAQALGPAEDWQAASLSIVPGALRWGASVTFRLDGDGDADQHVWIDRVSLVEPFGGGRNVVHNASFEETAPGATWPTAWEPPMDDQWVSWVGDRYRPPQLTSAARSGRRAMRCSVTYAEVSGLSQVVRLNQDEARPIGVGVWSKLDNSIGNGRPGGGYYGSDNLPNLTLFVYHQDGTMQEVPPTFSLGESDHDWDYRRGGFLPEKPVDRIRVQVTVLGTEPTTSLWIDDLEVFEWGGKGYPLPNAAMAPSKTLHSAWDSIGAPGEFEVAAAMGPEHLTLSIPPTPDSQAFRVYLNPAARAPFSNHHRYLFHVLRMERGKAPEFGTAVEKQGYVAEGDFAEATRAGIEWVVTAHGDEFQIPWRALGMDSPPDTPLGFNIRWSSGENYEFWTGKSPAVAAMGALIPPVPPGLLVRSLRFGNRWETETDQSQDLVSHPPIYAGINEGTVWVTNSGADAAFDMVAGVRGRPVFEGRFTIAANETKAVPFRYDAGSGNLGTFDIGLRQDGRLVFEDTYPLVAPPPVELVLDQAFYFPEEAEATVEVHARYRPLPEKGRAEVALRDLAANTVVSTLRHNVDGPVSTFRFPLSELRVNALPVQDYAVAVTLFDDRDTVIGTQSARFGRINHTDRPTLPPVESVKVDDTGRLLINGSFPFFPVVPSLNSEPWDEGIDLGGNMYRPIYSPDSKNPERAKSMVAAADKAWSKNVYLMPIGPGPGQVEAFEAEVPEIFAHPGFLGCYPKQFYYWNLSDDQVAYRRQLEDLFAGQSSRRLLVWGHHDSSFLYDHDMDWPDVHPAVGYCYVKIMGRPGSGWRNAPFLTLTEQVLDPSRFKLAEVNLYVAWHDDEIVPEHFSTYYSLRADPVDGFRNESYLSVIYGADGLYHYICVQPGGVQRLRGWFQELNHMWPVFASEDAGAAVAVSPAGSGIEARLKEHEGRWYLLTANAAERPTSATIRIEGLNGKEVTKLFDLPGGMSVEGDVISDTWGAQDAYVYEIGAE